MPEPTGYPDLDALLPRLDAIASLDSDALATEYTSVLGRKGGVLTAALRSVATIPVEQRKTYGAAVNRLKARFEEAFRRHRDELDAESRRRDTAGIDHDTADCHTTDHHTSVSPAVSEEGILAA